MVKQSKISPVVISILVALIWVSFLVAGLLLGLLFKWFVQLDSVLHAELFATLAGLSLAAAAFLLTSGEDAESRASDAASGVSSAREDAIHRTFEEDFEEDVVNAESWFLGLDPPRRGDVLSSSYDVEIKSYLLRKLDAKAFDNLAHSGKEAMSFLIMSFMFFVFGLIEAFTLDLWTSAKTDLRIPETGADLATMVNSTNYLVTLDILVSSVLLVLGVFYLIKGANALRSRA